MDEQQELMKKITMLNNELQQINDKYLLLKQENDNLLQSQQALISDLKTAHDKYTKIATSSSTDVTSRIESFKNIRYIVCRLNKVNDTIDSNTYQLNTTSDNRCQLSDMIEPLLVEMDKLVDTMCAKYIKAT